MLEIGDNIAKLDLIMFEYCCQFGEEIDKMNLIDQVPIYSSNLSTRSIRYLKPEQFIEISDKYDLDRKFIEVEVTEQVLINESGYSMIDELSDLGYNIAVDDFSAGYASLKYVSQMTADTLKIDRALLNDLELDEGARNVIYKAVIDLAKELGLNIVSEGIETKEQAKILKGLDGEIFQGFYCSEPIPKDEFLDYIYKYNMNKE
jgi:EAL domain-containing protein (putative c-di-GMP-specific phosphodiesterase class I)